MNLKLVKDIRDINEKEWLNFVYSHSEGNVFQTPIIFKLYKRTEKTEPIILAVKKDNKIVGILLAVIQKEHSGFLGKFSSRALIFGGPLVKKGSLNSEQLIRNLLLNEIVIQVKAKSIYLQIRNFSNVMKSKEVFYHHGFKYNNHLNYLINLDNHDDTFNKFKNEKRRQIRRSFETGVVISEAKNVEEIKAFFDILEKIYKEKAKKPLPHWSFFKNFFELEVGNILLVKFKDNIIGGALCPIYKNEVIYDWYRAGLDSEFKKQYPSIIAVYAGIEFGLKNNYKIYDFMGAGNPNQEYGVRKFKSQFGGDLVEYGRFERINKKLLFTLGKVGIKILGLLR